jgi:opine dehydrogenase
MVLRGIKVSAIYDKNAEAISTIKENGGIKMSGPVVQGFAPIEYATNNLEVAMNIGDAFLVCITSNIHEVLASEVAPYVKPEHTFVLLPGYVGSSIIFSNTLKKCGVKKLPLIGEAVSFPYATRLIEPAHAGIKSRKDALPVAALPANRNEEFIKIVKEAIPEAILSLDTLSVGFNNVNPATHVVFYLFNLGKVEAPEDKSPDFHSWGTPTVVRIQYDMDAERLAVMNAMKLETISYDEFHRICYHNRHYKPIPQAEGLPKNTSQVPDRFIDEDIPMGLVPMSDFGKKLGVPTPTIDVLIQMANLVRKKNFVIEGTTLEKMGISNMSVDEILDFVRG